jgi:hypothetical protein
MTADASFGVHSICGLAGRLEPIIVTRMDRTTVAPCECVMTIAFSGCSEPFAAIDEAVDKILMGLERDRIAITHRECRSWPMVSSCWSCATVFSVSFILGSLAKQKGWSRGNQFRLWQMYRQSTLWKPDL